MNSLAKNVVNRQRKETKMNVHVKTSTRAGFKPVLWIAALAVALTTVAAPEANAGHRYSKYGRATAGMIYEQSARRIPGCNRSCRKAANRVGRKAFDTGDRVNRYVQRKSRNAGRKLRNKYCKRSMRSKRSKRSRRSKRC